MRTEGTAFFSLKSLSILSPQEILLPGPQPNISVPENAQPLPE